MDGVGKFPSLFFFLSEEVASGEVFKLVVSDEVVGLGALAAAGAAEEEENVRFAEYALDAVVALDRSKLT